MSESEIKVTDTETRQWMEALTDSEKIELKRRALEKRAIELLQPPAAAPDLSGMSDAEFSRYKMKLGIGG